jgi:hypothetical protein
MFSELSCKTHNFIKVTFSLLILLPLTQPAHAAFTIEQVLSEPYFDASDIETVRKGGFGVAKIHEVSDREIAVAIACMVKGAPEDTLAPFLGDLLPIDADHLVAQGLINTDSHEQSFAVISLESDGRDEVQHYLDAHPGLGLNLSSDEIAALQALQGVDDPDRQVEALLEDILIARYLLYREDGLAGARPYARKNGEHISPGEELRKTEEDLKELHELYLDFHNAWLSYPRNMPKGVVRDDFFWVKMNLKNRPTFILSHRLATNYEDVRIVGIRDYYASHFFDVAERVAIVARIKSGEYILIFIERAWVDYWSDFASLSKAIGHKVMKKQMEHLLEDHGICGK